MGTFSPTYKWDILGWNNPLILTIDPIFQRDIQVGILLGMWHSSLHTCHPILRCVTSDSRNLRWNFQDLGRGGGFMGGSSKSSQSLDRRSDGSGILPRKTTAVAWRKGRWFWWVWNPLFRFQKLVNDFKDVKPPGESYHCPLPWIMDWWILCHVWAGTNGGWRTLRFFMAGHPWHILEWMCFSDEVLYRLPAPEGSRDLKIFFTPPMCSFRLTLTKKWINDHKGSWSLLLGMTMWSSPLFFPQEGLYSELFLGDLFRD